jgi:hypothetical protein
MKTRRVKNKRNKKSRTLKGGMLRLLTGIAALGAQGVNGRNRPEGSLVSPSYTRNYPSSAPLTLVKTPFVNAHLMNPVKAPVANAKDISGKLVSYDEALRRIDVWDAEVEVASSTPSMDSDDICSVAGGGSPLCSGSIPRSLMPQIKRVNRPGFFNFLKSWTGDDNIVHDEEISIEALKPSQRELMQSLMTKQINRAAKNGTTPPTVIVTHDPVTGQYTLYDGHHRWGAQYQQYLASGKTTGGTIKTTVIELPIAEALRLSAAFGAPHAVSE